MAPAGLSARRLGADLWWYAGAVVTGAVLFVAAAVNQPYNQNEIEQIAPYGSPDISTMTQGTRQPPLDALLGGLVQHALGEGQLRQRLTPVLAGVGTLVVLAALLRRLGLGNVGALSLWFLATQPLMVHYSAYARPYALPVFLSVAFVYSSHRWLEDRRVGSLVLALGAACALPLTRVPEPNVFLLASAAALAWLSVSGRRAWSQTAPLVAGTVAAVGLLGFPMYRSLSAGGPDFDPSLAGILSRFGAGVDELVTRVLPELGEWFPWWPVTGAVVVAALAIGDSRRKLFGEWGWAWWPLLLAPLAFLLAYHFMNPASFAVRPYRDRYAYFFLPPLGLLVAALAATTRRYVHLHRRLGPGLGVLLAAMVLGQLPATARVLTEGVAPDFVQAGEMLSSHVPRAATVVYLTPLGLDRWRQAFMDHQIDGSTLPPVVDSRTLAEHPRRAPTSGPVYVLVLAGECANSIFCDKPAPRWDRTVPGWKILTSVDRFTLYAPTQAGSGRSAVVDALVDFAAAFGPRYGMLETFAAAGILDLQGDAATGRSLIARAFAELDPPTKRCYRAVADRRGINPFPVKDGVDRSTRERALAWERAQEQCVLANAPD